MKLQPLSITSTSLDDYFGGFDEYANKVPVLEKCIGHHKHNYYSQDNKCGIITAIDYYLSPPVNGSLDTVSLYKGFTFKPSIEMPKTYPKNIVLEVMDGRCPDGFYNYKSTYIEQDFFHPCAIKAVKLGILSSISFVSFLYTLETTPALYIGLFEVGVLVYKFHKCNAYDHPNDRDTHFLEEVKTCLVNEDMYNQSHMND